MNVQSEKPLKVINLFGAPGQGKSATAGGLFWLMKVQGYSVELISEYAKYLILTGRNWQLEYEQSYLLAKQHHKQTILKGHYDWAITDSPLMLASYYAKKEKTPESFFKMVPECAAQFENINFFLYRDVLQDFEETGRIHNKEQSLEIMKDQKNWLTDQGVAFTEVCIDEKTPWTILELLAQKDATVAPSTLSVPQKK